MEFTNLICTPLAYIGPGAGMGLLVSLFGLVAAIATALFTIAWWPIRKMLKRRKLSKPEQ